MVEEHGLEALAIDSRETEPGERETRTRCDRRGHASAHELHPVPMLEPCDEPERDRKQDDYRGERSDPLDEFALERRNLDDEGREQPRRGRREDGSTDPRDQRPPIVRRAAGLEGAEQDRDQQYRLETLTEENRERERECEQRRRNPLVRERTVDLAQTLLYSDRVGPHGRKRGSVSNPVPELGELEFQVEDEIRVAQPERNLCELEVIEVRGPGDAVRTVAIPCCGS